MRKKPTPPPGRIIIKKTKFDEISDKILPALVAISVGIALISFVISKIISNFA